MDMKMLYEDTTLTIYLSGELDHHCAASVREAVDLALDRYSPVRLVLDFGRVGSMDSSAIGLALGRYHILKRSGGSVRLQGLSRSYYKMMCLAKLDSFMEVAANETDK